MLEMELAGVLGLLNSVWDWILTYAVVISWYMPKQLAERHNVTKDLIKRNGQVAIVTGGGRGIGLEVVRQFVAEGMQVIIACRRPNELSDLVRQLADEHANSKVEARELDLCSLASVRKFAEEFLSSGRPLHVLINNAGVMFCPRYETKDGFELQLGVNYLGHFLLTHLLLPRLKETGIPNQFARIINVSSCVCSVGKINFDDLQSRRAYSSYGCYTQSKLAQLMHARSLQENLSAENANVTINALHPGIIYSDLHMQVWLFRVASFFFRMIFKSTKQGADSILTAASSKRLEGVGGRYFENSVEAEPPKFVLDPEIRKRLWIESNKLVGIEI